jgi:Na+:H+ antiporter, NhaA family
VNAGLALNAQMFALLLEPLPLGVALGVFIGKQLGIFGAIWAAVRFNIADCPSGANWAQIYGMSLLCGIGFTMSLFIGGLAFPGQAILVEEAKGGILMGSLLSALVGFAVLRWAAPGERRPEITAG